MKRFLITFLTCSVALNLLAAYNQQGIAYFYDYKTKKKTPLSGVSINVNGAQPAISGVGGAFTLKFSSLGPGQKISFSKQPYYQGMKVFNKQVVDNWYIVQGKLVLIMCKYEEFELAKNNYYAQGKASVEKKFKSKIEALSKEVQRLRKENKDCAQQMQELQELNEEYERIMDDLRNSADAMARIDQSELDAEMQEILDLYEQGEVDEAMEKLNSMELDKKFVETLERKQYHERELAIAERDSALVIPLIRGVIADNDGDTIKTAEYLKLLADNTNSFDDIYAYAFFCDARDNVQEAEKYYNMAISILKSNKELLSREYYSNNLYMVLSKLSILYNRLLRMDEYDIVVQRCNEIINQINNR